MILSKVKLKNFISHEKTEIIFDYGINVITGANGSGKTSILDAISFGLFNVHNRGKKKSLINSRAKKADISVEFKESGIDYVTEWTLSRGKTSYGSLFRLQNGDRVLQARGGERTIVSEIGKILGMDKTLFLQSVYIQQGEIENLVTATPAVRKSLISKLLGVEDLDKAWGNMRDLMNAYKLIVANLEGELKKVPELKDNLRKDETELHNLKGLLQNKRSELEITQSEIDDLKKELKRLEESKEEYEKLSSQLEIVKTQLEAIKTKLDDQKKALEKANTANDIVENLKKIIGNLPYLEKYTEAQSEKEKQELQEKSLTEELKHIEELQSILDEKKENYQLYSEKTRIASEKREERKEYEGADSALRKATKHFKKIETEKENKEQELLEELENCTITLETQTTIENLETTLQEKISEEQKTKTEIEKRIENYNKEIGGLEQAITDLEYKVSQISETDVCPICHTKLTATHLQNLQNEFESEKLKAAHEINTLKKELENGNLKKKEVETRLEKLLSINPDGIKQLSTQLESLKDEIKQENSEIDMLKASALKLQELDREITKLEAETKQVQEDYQNYESAKREIARTKTIEDIKKELSPIETKLREIANVLNEIEGNLGYIPEKPLEELHELRIKKEKYDKNEPIALEKPDIEKAVALTLAELSDRKIELDSLNCSMSQLAYEENQLKQKKESFEAKEKAKFNLEKEIVATETSFDNLLKEKSKLIQELGRLSEKQIEKNHVAKFIKTLEIIRSAFGKDGIQKLIRARARPSLEHITREFFEKFNLEYSDIKIDDDYDINVIGPTGSKTIDQISGGERVALAIALRLAIARVLSEKVETIIMDEPTTHLDAERRKELVSILNSFFREGSRIFPQMLIITHHREIEDIADVIYNINKREGCSIVTFGDLE